MKAPCNLATKAISKACGVFANNPEKNASCVEKFSQACPTLQRQADKTVDFICKKVVKMC